MPAAVVALLGRADAPTDGVHDFVTRLGAAVDAAGVPFALERLPPTGRPARARLRALLDKHPGAWFVLQYTALQWSSRAVPAGLPGLLRLIRTRGGRAGIVFHDIAPYPGTRPIDRVRRTIQRRAMRVAAATADQAFIAGQHRAESVVPEGFAGWVPRTRRPLVFLPVGAILPPGAPVSSEPPRLTRPGGRVRVGIFGVSDHRDHVEVPQIAETLRQASARLGAIDVVAFGRGTDRARPLFARLLPHGTDARVLGVLTPEAIRAELTQLDALLFVRHHLSAQRSSAMAAVAAGVPIVGFRGRHTGAALEGWGVRLADEGHLTELAAHLAAVTSDTALWQSLRAANLAAAHAYLEWPVIGHRFLEALAR